MPFKRSNNNSRNNSRSPVPPPGFSAPRPFLPPSHYAAAGGLDYFTRTAPQTSNSQPESIPPQTPAIYKHTTDSKKHNRNSLVPISYPSESDASFEFVPAEDPVSNTLSSNRSSYDIRGKRQSHMQSVPLLETQLLPSLRDTIDRMTRPPSQCLYNPPLSGPAHPALQNQRGRSPSPSASSVTSTATYTSVPAPSSLHPKSAPSTPRPSPMTRQGAMIPTESSSSKTKPKSALKSALRAPTPKSSSVKSTGTDSPSFSPGASLRSVRSILGRKASTTSTLKDNRKGGDVVTSSGNTSTKVCSIETTIQSSFSNMNLESQAGSFYTYTEYPKWSSSVSYRSWRTSQRFDGYPTFHSAYHPSTKFQQLQVCFQPPTPNRF